MTGKGSKMARYDEFAEWYGRWVEDAPGLIADPALGRLPAELGGQRWLDLACGAGRTSRELARRGAAVLGVDLSREMVALARHADTSRQIAYVVADINRPSEWWDGRPFDGATCEMAFMDIDDLEGTVAAVARVLRPGGRFLASLINPCFPGNEAGLSSWPPERGYTAEGFWRSPQHNPDGVRSRVGSNHRTLSTYLNALIEAGFDLERAAEPPASVPTWLILACRRGRRSVPTGAEPIETAGAS